MEFIKGLEDYKIRLGARRLILYFIGQRQETIRFRIPGFRVIYLRRGAAKVGEPATLARLRRVEP